MPTVVGIDTFQSGTFTVPPYKTVTGTPVRDTLVIRGGDPASMKIAATGAALNVDYPNIAGSATLGWHGFAWRLDANTAASFDVATFKAAAGNSAKLTWGFVAQALVHYVGGGTPQSGAYTYGTFAWIEQIFDVSGATRAIYTRVNGVDMTVGTEAGAASTILNSNLGSDAQTNTSWYSLYLWGTATGITDWLGESAAKEYLPGRGIILESVTNPQLSQTFSLPWEVVGSVSSSALGAIPSTQSIVRVYDTLLRAPASTDDSTLGYATGDVWIYNLQAWWCVSAASGAAVWKQVA